MGEPRRYSPADDPVSEEFLDAVLSDMSYYGPLIKSMAAELRALRQAVQGR